MNLRELRISNWRIGLFEEMKNIILYKGFDDITFDLKFNEVKRLLREKFVEFNTEHWQNKGCTPEVAWDIIRIGKDISIFFCQESNV